MKTLYLHIGLQKTGTSTIQMSFMRPGGPLEQAGIDYLPAVIAPRHAHHSVAWEIAHHKRYVDGQPGLAALTEAAAASKAERLFVSTEEFSLLAQREVNSLARGLDGFDVRPILCLRNQLSWSESLYAQACKRGYAEDFATFGATLARDGKLDYGAIIDRWASAFGRDRITLLVYEDHRDIAAALAAHLGLTLTSEPARKNRSLNERFVQASQAVIARCKAGALTQDGQTIPRKMTEEVARAVLAAGSRLDVFQGSPVFLDHDAAQAFLAPWRDVNRRIAAAVPLPDSYFTAPATRRTPYLAGADDIGVLVRAVFDDPAIRNGLAAAGRA